MSKRVARKAEWMFLCHMGHVSCHARAPVVDARNCSITGSEAWISAEKAPWAYRSRSECCAPVILRQAIVEDIDCDVAFAAWDEGDGLGCKSCEPGTLFVKNSTTNTIENGSKIQRCVPCPDGAKICNATAVEMMPGFLAESIGAKSFLPLFPKIPQSVLATHCIKQFCTRLVVSPCMVPMTV